jgi:CheY-like chemotaxis protein
VRFFEVPNKVYIELPSCVAHVPMRVLAITPTSLWLETDQPIGIDLRANLRVIFPNVAGSIGVSAQVTCRGRDRELQIDLDVRDPWFRDIICAWSEGRAAQIDFKAPPPRRPFTRMEEISAPRASLFGKGVLIIEDNELVARVLRNGLVRRGGRVHVAGDGEQGMAIARTEDIDAIVLDWMLPKRAGEEVIGDLKIAVPHIPVAVVSGIASSEPVRATMRRLGADEVFAKPLRLREITDWIARKLAV